MRTAADVQHVLHAFALARISSFLACAGRACAVAPTGLAMCALAITRRYSVAGAGLEPPCHCVSQRGLNA